MVLLKSLKVNIKIKPPAMSAGGFVIFYLSLISKKFYCSDALAL